MPDVICIYKDNSNVSVKSEMLGTWGTYIALTRQKIGGK